MSPLNEDISYRKKAKKTEICQIKRQIQKTIEKNALQSMQELMENSIEQRWKDWRRRKESWRTGQNWCFEVKVLELPASVRKQRQRQFDFNKNKQFSVFSYQGYLESNIYVHTHTHTHTRFMMLHDVNPIRYTVSMKPFCRFTLVLIGVEN